MGFVGIGNQIGVNVIYWLYQANVRSPNPL